MRRRLPQAYLARKCAPEARFCHNFSPMCVFSVVRVKDTMKKDRRAFVGSGLALAGLAGTITGLDSSAGAVTKPSTGPSFASFGWEVTDLNNNGADVYFEVISNMIGAQSTPMSRSCSPRCPPIQDSPKCCAEQLFRQVDIQVPTWRSRGQLRVPAES
jgi:hypothetical protein